MEAGEIRDSETSYWLDRFGKIRQHVGKDGRRAPHKPLLLLYMLGKFRTTGSASVTFLEAEPALHKLLTDFGTPTSKPRPEFPFTRLENDGLWFVTGPNGEPNPGENSPRLLRAGYVGSLSPDLLRALTNNPTLLNSLSTFLIEREFPESIHSLIASATELSFDRSVYFESFETVLRRKRVLAFRDEILAYYEGLCTFCGFHGQLDEVNVGVEAAHIRWFAYDGANDLSNGIALCAIHHLLFDLGVMGLDDDLKITVSKRFDALSTSAFNAVDELDGEPLVGLSKASKKISRSSILWHRSQVFKGSRTTRV